MRHRSLAMTLAAVVSLLAAFLATSVAGTSGLRGTPAEADATPVNYYFHGTASDQANKIAGASSATATFNTTTSARA